MHESHRYYTMSYVRYDVVGAYRPKRRIYAYDVYIRYRMRYTSYLEPLPVLLVALTRPLPPQLLQPLDPLPCQMVCTVLWQSRRPDRAVQASQMAHPDSPPASQPEAAGALAVRQCQNNLNVICAISTNCVSQSDNCHWMTASGASDCYWCVSCRGLSVSALNLKYNCTHFVTIHLHTRAPAKVCARDFKKATWLLDAIAGNIKLFSWDWICRALN